MGFDWLLNPLSITIFAPLLGALVIMLLPARAAGAIKGIALGTAGGTLLACLDVVRRFDPSRTGFEDLLVRVSWIPAFNIEYFLGVDGLSVTMVLLTGLLSFLCVIASWNIEEWKVNRGIKGYFALFLMLEAGMMGVFEALDFFLFYIFWELMLLPMYFLIGVWGGPRREYAAIKFFLYTLAGSVLMLVVMLAMYFTVDARPDLPGMQRTFDLTRLAQVGPGIFKGGWWMLAFLALYVGFAIKVPVFPFHTWLPDAHVEAPTPISVILAGVLLKMGTYGLMRISYPILPEAALRFAPYMMIFGVVNIIYGSLCAMAQIRGVPRVDPKTGEQYVERDWKKLIAYSSVAHMGFCLIGLAACTPAGVTGCLFQMWNHGCITGMLFLLVGVIYDRAHHRDIDGFGGLWKVMPHYGSLTALAFMASLGLPGLAGFVSEFLCFVGAFQGGGSYVFAWGSAGAPWLTINSSVFFKVLTSASVAGVVLGAAYFLWSYQKVFLGPLNPKYERLFDMTLREKVSLWPLAIIVVVLGVYPLLYLDLVGPAVQKLVVQVGMPWVTGMVR